jgi:hypothetical protein
MGLLDILIVLGILASFLIDVGALLYFAYQIWRCSLAAAKGGRSRRPRQSVDDHETHRIARAAYVAHRDRASRGMITLLLSLFVGIGLGVVGDRRSGGWPNRLVTVCEGVELCK